MKIPENQYLILFQHSNSIVTFIYIFLLIASVCQTRSLEARSELFTSIYWSISLSSLIIC